MSDPKLTYIGPLEAPALENKGLIATARNAPWAFLLIVVAPTLLVAVYYFLIATPRYVSEARFIVREAGRQQPTALGLVLQGAGLSAGQSDAFAVHQYLTSRDVLREINARGAVSQALSRPEADFLSKRPLTGEKFDDLYSGFQDYLTVGYDTATGISVVRVQAFRATDARNMNEALLDAGERLVNRLNDRANQDAVAQAARAAEEARMRLARAQSAMAGFRNQEQFLDPEASARESGALIGNLSSTLANLRAERAQLAEEAPNSPQLPALDGRIRAYTSQLEAERRKLTGGSEALAPKIGAYETIALERQLAAQALSAANVALDAARLDAGRQHLYLERVVSPNLPDKPTMPNRWKSVLTVLLTTLVIYALGWLLVAGLREHQQN